MLSASSIEFQPCDILMAVLSFLSGVQGVKNFELFNGASNISNLRIFFVNFVMLIKKMKMDFPSIPNFLRKSQKLNFGFSALSCLKVAPERKKNQDFFFFLALHNIWIHHKIEMPINQSPRRLNLKKKTEVNFLCISKMVSTIKLGTAPFYF